MSTDLDMESGGLSSLLSECSMLMKHATFKVGTRNVESLLLILSLVLFIHFPFKFGVSCLCKFLSDREIDKFDEPAPHV